MVRRHSQPCLPPGYAFFHTRVPFSTVGRHRPLGRCCRICASSQGASARAGGGGGWRSTQTGFGACRGLALRVRKAHHGCRGGGAAGLGSRHTISCAPSSASRAFSPSFRPTNLRSLSVSCCSRSSRADWAWSSFFSRAAHPKGWRVCVCERNGLDRDREVLEGGEGGGFGTGPWGGGGGGRSGTQKNCVPQMARQDFPNNKFRFSNKKIFQQTIGP